MSETQPELYIDEKWDKVIDVMVKRTLTGVFAGAVGGFLLFRTSPSLSQCTGSEPEYAKGGCCPRWEANSAL